MTWSNPMRTLSRRPSLHFMEGLKSRVVPFLRVLLTVIGIPIAGRPRTKPLHSLPVFADKVCIDRLIQNRERVSNIFDDLDYIFAE